MTPLVVAAGAALAALLLVALVVGLSGSPGTKRQIGSLFRRTPSGKPAPSGHYYKPYWSW